MIALTHVECYRAHKDAFQETLHKRPEIAEDISQVLARHRAELEAAREDLIERGQARPHARPSGGFPAHQERLCPLVASLHTRGC